MFDEDVLADVKINLVNVPVNIDRQIVSGMRMPLVASATKGTLQGILIQSMVRGLTRGRVAAPMNRANTRLALRTERAERAQRFDPSRFRSSSEAHSQLIRQTDKEWRNIVRRSAGNPQQLKKETELFYNRLRSRIGNFQIDRVKRGEISLEQAIPRPTGGQLYPTREIGGRQSALEGVKPVTTRALEFSTNKRQGGADSSRIIMAQTTTRRETADTTRTIPASITRNINAKTAEFSRKQIETFSRGNEYGNVRSDLLRRGVLDLGGQSRQAAQRESQIIGLQRQRQMFRERREAAESETKPFTKRTGGSGDDTRFREGK